MTHITITRPEICHINDSPAPSDDELYYRAGGYLLTLEELEQRWDDIAWSEEGM